MTSVIKILAMALNKPHKRSVSVNSLLTTHEPLFQALYDH